MDWQALRAVEESLQVQPRNQKAYEAQGMALFKLGRFKAAAGSCRIAEGIAGAKSNLQTSLSLLQDEIALTAALHSSFDGFDGRLLQVKKGSWPAAHRGELHKPVYQPCFLDIRSSCI